MKVNPEGVAYRFEASDAPASLKFPEGGGVLILKNSLDEVMIIVELIEGPGGSTMSLNLRVAPGAALQRWEDSPEIWALIEEGRE